MGKYYDSIVNGGGTSKGGKYLKFIESGAYKKKSYGSKFGIASLSPIEQASRQEEQKYNQQLAEQERMIAEEEKAKKEKWKRLLLGDPSKPKTPLKGNIVQKGVQMADNAGRGQYGLVGAAATFPVSGVAALLNTADKGIRAYTGSKVMKKADEADTKARDYASRLRKEGKISQEQYAKLLSSFDKSRRSEMDDIDKKFDISKSTKELTAKKVAGDAGMAAIDMATLGLGSSVFKGTSKGFQYVAPKAAAKLATEQGSKEIVKVLSKEGMKNVGKTGLKGAGLASANTVAYGMSENKSAKDIAKDLPASAALGFAMGSGAEALGQGLKNKGLQHKLDADAYTETLKKYKKDSSAYTRTINKSNKEIASKQEEYNVTKAWLKEVSGELKAKKKAGQLSPTDELALRKERSKAVRELRVLQKDMEKLGKTVEDFSSKKAQLSTQKLLELTPTQKRPVLDAVRAGLKANPESKTLKFIEETISKPRAYRETLTNIEKISPETAKIIKAQAATEGVYRGEGEMVLQAIQTKANKDKSLWQTLANELRTKPREELTGDAKIVADLLDKRANELRKQGVSVGHLENYFPRLIDPSQKRQLQEVLEANGFKDKASILETLYNRNLRPSKADLEYGRVFEDLPDEVKAQIEKFYVQDPATILANWNKETAGRLAEAEFSGANLERLRESYGDASDDAAAYIKDMYSLWRFGRTKTDVEQTIKGIEVFTKMGMSTLSNISQHTNTATVAGVRTTAKAIKEAAHDPKAAEQLALKAGVNVHEMTDELTQALYEAQRKNPAVNAAEWLLKINGFKEVEKGNRLVATIAGRDFILNLAKNPEKYSDELAEYGLNSHKIAQKGLSQDDLHRGIYEFVGKTQFYTDTMRLPGWTTKTGTGEIVSTLSKFSFKQTKLLKDNIVKNLMKGNPVPLMRYLFVGSVFGELTGDVRNAITGQEREYTWSEIQDGVAQGDYNPLLHRMLKENVARAGGYGYMYDMAQNMEFAKEPWEKPLVALGPVGSDVRDVIKGFQTHSEEGGEKATEYATKQVVKRIPFLDPALTQGKKLGGADYTGVPIIGKGLDGAATTYNPSVFKAGNERDAMLKKVSPEARKLYPTLHQMHKGETPLLYTARKAAAYIDYPELFVLDKKYYKAQKENTGKDYDPIYDLTLTQAKQVFAQTAKGDKWNEKELYAQEWYKNFKDKRSEYYNGLRDSRTGDYAGAEADEFYVEKSQHVKDLEAMGNYDNAAVKDYQEKNKAMKNAKREEIGLVTPDRYDLEGDLIFERGATIAKDQGGKLAYMQAIRSAGMGYDKFFEEHPELDPLNGAVIKGSGLEKQLKYQQKKYGKSINKQAKIGKPLNESTTKTKKKVSRAKVVALGKSRAKLKPSKRKKVGGF
jgi:hypothetical protein